jgi:MFS family permease
MPAAASGEVGLTLRQALHTPSFWLLSLVVGVAAIASTGVTFHQVAHFTDVGISATVAASTSSVFTLVQTGSVFASGFVAERVGPRVAVLVTILIIMVGVYRIWHVGSAAEAYIAAAIFGIGLGAYGTLINLLWADYFGREYLGSIRGVSLFFQLVGNAGGSLISAAVFDLTGSYSGAFTGVLIMDAAIVVMLLMARRPHQQRVTATASGEARPG